MFVEAKWEIEMDDVVEVEMNLLYMYDVLVNNPYGFIYIYIYDPIGYPLWCKEAIWDRLLCLTIIIFNVFYFA